MGNVCSKLEPRGLFSKLENMKFKRRCPWAEGADPLMQQYHDTEWGVATKDDQKLFEFLILESAQAGLSWRTILTKRENYRKAFAHFDPKKIANFKSKDIARLLKDAGIVRNRLKILAAINNAKRFLEVQKEFGSFWKYSQQFKKKGAAKQVRTARSVPSVTPESEAFAKDLKKRGFKFLGPTVMYAHMQAVGIVNDHLQGCFRTK